MPRETLDAARGLAVGEAVRVLVPTLGDDENEIERSFPAGAMGVIVLIQDLGPPQGIAFHVAVENAITQVFDEADGPIIAQIEPLAPRKAYAAPPPFNWDYADDRRFLYLYLNGVQIASVIDASGNKGGAPATPPVFWGFNSRTGDYAATHGHVDTVEQAVTAINRLAEDWMIEVVQQIERTLKRGGA